VEQWYCAFCTPQGEARAKLGIEAAGFEAFLPVERIRGPLSVKRRQHAVMARPLFPRYLFAYFDAGTDHHKIIAIDGIEHLLQNAGKLVKVPQSTIDVFRNLQRAGVFDRVDPMSGLKSGDAVKITEGPFAGLIARVKSARSRDRIKVLLEFLGQATEADLSVEMMGKVGHV